MGTDIPQAPAPFTVFGTVDDFTGRLTVAAVLPGTHAEQVVELREDEPDVSRYAHVFIAPDADQAAKQARDDVDEGQDHEDDDQDDAR